MGRPRVGFLIIGTQKAGTSALEHHLKQHDQIGTARHKELHFFDRETFYGLGDLAYYFYERKFDFSTKKEIYGEATPIYLYWEGCARRIWKYNPDIKLIAILRNPISRAFSSWNMERGRGNDELDFMSAIERERERVKSALPFQHRLFSYVDRGFYSEQIRAYRRYFDDEQMLFIKYEDFKKDQEQWVKEVVKFLGLDVGRINYEPMVVNHRPYSSEMPQAAREHLQSVYQHDIKEVEKLLGWNCDDWN